MKYKWHIMYDLAKSYYDKNKNLLVSQSSSDEETRLIGIWLANQRQLRKNNILSEYKIQLLDDIGMIWDVNKDKWMTNYNELKKYYEINNNINIPLDYKIIGYTGKEQSLYDWVDAQRYKYNNNKLKKWQIDLLNELKFVWNIKLVFSFDEGYEVACKYFNKYGHLQVMNGHIEVMDNGSAFNLSDWINCQRRAYHEGKLDDKKIELLNDINMVWNVKDKKISNVWYRNYYYAKQFFNKWNHLNVKYNYSFIDEQGNTICLGQWIVKQRQSYKNNKLIKEQIDLLNDINMVWQIKDISQKSRTNWKRNYQLAKEYYSENGHLLIPLDYKVVYNDKLVSLGTWISDQRNCYKHNKLEEWQIILLDNINMIWTLKFDNWDSYYEKLKEYKIKYGDLFISDNYILNDGDNIYDLYKFVMVQKDVLPKRNGLKFITRYKMLDDLDLNWNMNITDDILFNYINEQYTNYIYSLDDDYDVLKLIDSGAFVYEDDCVKKSDVSYFKKMIEKRITSTNE